jgi:hypothetical protein
MMYQSFIQAVAEVRLTEARQRAERARRVREARTASQAGRGRAAAHRRLLPGRRGLAAQPQL